MKIIILILCCVCGNYGENSTTVSVLERSTVLVTFNVSIVKENARCISSKKELILEEGKTVKLRGLRINIPKNNNDQQQKPTEEIQKVKCTYTNSSGQHELGEEYNIQESNGPWEKAHTITKDMYGVWSCKLNYNEEVHRGEIKPTEQVNYVRYSYVICNITVKKPDLPTTPVQTDTLNTQMWYIIGGVIGTLVLLIIIGQTIALCYFRRKAQPGRRMDNMGNMAARSRSNTGDRARYSAPPCKKSKSSARANADTDSHIYEMVGVNALYHKSGGLHPGADTDTAEKNIRDRPPLPLPHESSGLHPGADNDTAEKKIRDRPPLPLPHEIPKPMPAKTLPRNKPVPITSMPSTVSLDSTNSSSSLISKKKGKELPPPPGQGTKKAPARPPKQIDEDNIPGSLRRTAMPTTAPAVATAPAKIATLPKAPSIEYSMSELKNIFRMRNIGKDTPTSSPAATLERKEPTKVQKTSTQTKTQTQKQPPNVSIKPIVNQQNQIKLILPKIEASLKAPKPLLPKAIEPTVSPIKSPPPPKKPSQVVSQNQKPVTTPASKTVQKQPLPTPEPARKLPPEPISPYPVASLPPIYQTSDEDLTPGTDDEEWTYEQLGQYNIYNI